MKLKVKWIMYKNVSENTGLFPVVRTLEENLNILIPNITSLRWSVYAYMLKPPLL